MSELSYEDVCRFLFEEATLLDGFELQTWLTMLSDDVRYRMTGPTIRQSGERKSTYPSEVVLFDENKASLAARVKQLTTPAWTVSENPQSITRRFVSNVVRNSEGDGLRVRSNLLVYRTRLRETEPHLFSITRSDVLRVLDGRLLLVDRKAELDEALIGARNISMLF